MEFAATNAHYVFSYAYRPAHPIHFNNGGGFVVNLLDNGYLVFEVFNVHHVMVQRSSFQLPGQVVSKYQQEVREAQAWLCTMPKYLAENEGPQFSSVVMVDGFTDPFRLDDLPLLVNSPFRSTRGHYARLMYNFLENIAGILAHCGIDLRLDNFIWNEKLIQPVVGPSMENTMPRMFG